MDNDWESRWGCINSIWVTLEGVFCFGWLLHASRVGAGLMDGSRPEISWRASEQDTGGGLWGPRRSVGLGLLSFFKPLSTCRLSSLFSILSLPPLFSPPHCAELFFCSTSKWSPLLVAALSQSLQHAPSQTSIWDVFNAIMRWQPRQRALQQGEMDSCRG